MDEVRPDATGMERRGRRAILLGFLSGLGVWGANALGASGVRAGGNGQPVLLGQTNTATSGTVVSRTNVDTNVTLGGGNYAVAANAHVSNGLGVIGHVSGTSGIGVQGQTSGHWSQIALHGRATTGNGEGIAIKAETLNGSGVHTTATGGYALEVHGRAIFSRSGKVTFQTGQKSRTVTRQDPGNVITTSTIIVATIQGNVAGTWVAGAVRSGDQSFVIHLNKAAPSQLKVGFFLIN